MKRKLIFSYFARNSHFYAPTLPPTKKNPVVS